MAKQKKNWSPPEVESLISAFSGTTKTKSTKTA